MKATIEFQLPEDHHQHLRAIHANEAWTALYDIDSMLRNLIKYGDNRYNTLAELAHAIREEARYALDKIDE